MKTNRETRDLAEAKERAKRAKAYAEKFPQFATIDSDFCDPDWQLVQLRGFSEKSCPQK